MLEYWSKESRLFYCTTVELFHGTSTFNGHFVNDFYANIYLLDFIRNKGFRLNDFFHCYPDSLKLLEPTLDICLDKLERLIIDIIFQYFFNYVEFFLYAKHDLVS